MRRAAANLIKSNRLVPFKFKFGSLLDYKLAKSIKLKVATPGPVAGFSFRQVVHWPAAATSMKSRLAQSQLRFYRGAFSCGEVLNSNSNSACST